MKRVLEHFGGEGASCHAREFAGKGKYHHCVDPGGCQQFEFLWERRDERLARFRTNDTGWVWVEGDSYGTNFFCASLGCGLGDEPLVATMNTIEVSDGRDRGAEVGGDIGELAEYLHQAISKLILRPS